MSNNDTFKQKVLDANIDEFAKTITTLIEIDDYIFDSDEFFASLLQKFEEALSSNELNESCEDLVKIFQEEHYTDKDLEQGRKELVDIVNTIIDENKITGRKREFIWVIWQKFLDIYDTARNRYLMAKKIELPIKLDENAKLPAYAHENDACADLYAREDQILKAHSFSNKIDTGVHIALPKGWKACIAARSSIGAKTGLRLSNAVAQIDEGYRGALIVLYDNHSDSDYEIKAGDRIAQMWIEPVYQFAAKQVDDLDDTERSSGGLGSTGR